MILNSVDHDLFFSVFSVGIQLEFIHNIKPTDLLRSYRENVDNTDDDTFIQGNNVKYYSVSAVITTTFSLDIRFFDARITRRTENSSTR